MSETKLTKTRIRAGVWEGVLRGGQGAPAAPALGAADRAARARLGDLSALITDRLSGIRVVQGFAREDAEAERIRALGEDLYAEGVKAVTIRNRAFPRARFVGNLGNVIMLGGGAWLIMAGQFTLGGLLAYRGYGTSTVRSTTS